MPLPTNAREWALKILPYVAVLAIGVGLGYGIKPATRIEEREKIVEKQVTTEAIKEMLARMEQLNSKIDSFKEAWTNEKFHQEIDEKKLPDGTYTKKTITDKNVDSHTKETETKVETKVVTVVETKEVEKRVEVEKIVEKEKIVTPLLPQWDFGLGVGVSPSFLPSIKVDSIVITGEVNHRLFGPFWIGLWGAGTTQGQAMGGLKVKMETK